MASKETSSSRAKPSRHKSSSSRSKSHSEDAKKQPKTDRRRDDHPADSGSCSRDSADALTSEKNGIAEKDCASRNRPTDKHEKAKNGKAEKDSASRNRPTDKHEKAKNGIAEKDSASRDRPAEKHEKAKKADKAERDDDKKGNGKKGDRKKEDGKKPEGDGKMEEKMQEKQEKKPPLKVPGTDTNSRDPELVRARLYVGNLDTTAVSRADLLEKFCPHGDVLGLSVHKGYAFVQYSWRSDAQKALKAEQHCRFGPQQRCVRKSILPVQC